MDDRLKYDEGSYQSVVDALTSLKQDVDGTDDHHKILLGSFNEYGISAYLADVYGAELENLDSIAMDISEKLKMLIEGDLPLGREEVLAKEAEDEQAAEDYLATLGQVSVVTQASQATQASAVNQANQASVVTQATQASIVTQVTQDPQASIVNQAGQQVLYGPGPVNQVSQANQASVVTQATQASVVTQANQATQAGQASVVTQASVISQANQAGIVSQVNQASVVTQANQASVVTQASQASHASQVSQASQVSHASQATQASVVTQASQATQASVVTQASQISHASQASQATQASVVTQASQASHASQVSQASSTGSIGVGTSKGKNTNGTGKNATSSLKDALGKKASNIIDAVEKGAARLAKGISPRFSGEDGSGMSAAAIAGAGLAGAGIALGTGILVGKRFQTYTFTPEDWENVDDPTKEAIIADMKKAEFSDNEIETFKNSTFKIRASELNEHTKKITKANEIEENLEEQFKAIYNYSLFDDENNIIRYFTFITMIIDGKKATDDFNMYNILNPILGDEDDADFIYTGISMEEYIVDEDEVEQVEISETREEEIQEGQSVDAVDKEWLNGIGLDSN